MENLGGSRSWAADQVKNRTEMLMHRAMERGEPDNITAVLVMAERQNGFGSRFGNRDTGFLIRKKLMVTEGHRLDMDNCGAVRTEE